MSDSPARQRMRRWSEAYRTLALHVLNFLILLVLVNLAIEAWFGFNSKASGGADRYAEWQRSPERGRPRLTPYRTPWQIQVCDMDGYDGVSRDDAESVLDEFTILMSQGFQYWPSFQYRTPLFSGRLVHIDPGPGGIPIRRTLPPVPADDRPERLVFVFGGSTTYGFFLADAWTMPTYLAAALQKKADAAGLKVRIKVVNFGDMAWNSSQELALFNHLLKINEKPWMAVFVDGVNDVVNATDTPSLTEPIRMGLQQRQALTMAERLSFIPMVRLALHIRGQRPVTTAPPPPPEPPARLAENILRVYRHNVKAERALAAAHGIRTLHIWQPSAAYGYDRKLSRFDPFTPDLLERYKLVYDAVKAAPGDAIFLGDAIREYGPDKRILVDEVHYGPKFSQYFAERISEKIDF